MNLMKALSGGKNAGLPDHRKKASSQFTSSGSHQVNPDPHRVGRRHFLKRSAAGIFGAVAGGSVLAACDVLEPKVHSQLSAETLTTEEGLVSALGAAYAEASYSGFIGKNALTLEEWTTGIELDSGGREEGWYILMSRFTWGASFPQLNDALWNKPYRAIRNANVILDAIDRADISDEQKKLYSAEARFVRALCYIRLYLWYGPVPLRTSAEQELELPRAAEEEVKSFIEEELLSVIPLFPDADQQPNYGRATSGAARAHLCKFYLNTKQWQNAADMAQEVMDMGAYALYPTYIDMFKVENEQNSGMIWVHPAVVDPGEGNEYVNGAFPPSFSEDPGTGARFTNSMNNWQTQYRLHDRFYHSFDAADERRRPILDEYIDTDGQRVSLLEKENNTRSFKYFPDPDAIGNNHGNDIPDIRYADILLSRAEALNELNGPNQASLSLINQVRRRAGVADVTLAEVSSKEALRDHLLKERGWEFYTERKRREDLIRMGKFIASARERGVDNVQPYHVRFAIPQPALDANPKLEQNEGY